MLFRSLIFVCFFGHGFAAVYANQGCLQNKYEVGDSAIIYCNITTNKEVIRSCTIMWEIWDEVTSGFKEIIELPKYHNRVSVTSQDFFSFVTIRELMVTDTEEILCTGVCFVDGDLQYINGNGTALLITEQDQKKPAFAWLKYLVFSINCVIFSISLVIFVCLIRKCNIQKNLQK